MTNTKTPIMALRLIDRSSRWRSSTPAPSSSATSQNRVEIPIRPTMLGWIATNHHTPARVATAGSHCKRASTSP